MKNALHRLGRLEFVRDSAAIHTRVSVAVDRYMGEGGQAHLLSVFGGDTEIAAFAAAISERQPFILAFPGGQTRTICLGEAAIYFRSSISIPERKRPVRHLVALSQHLQANGSAGTVFLLNNHPDLAWAVLTSALGIPALPEWGGWVLEQLAKEKRIIELDGLGCAPCRFNLTAADVLEWISKGLKQKHLRFPDKNGPITWPRYTTQDALRCDGQDGLVDTPEGDSYHDADEFDEEPDVEAEEETTADSVEEDPFEWEEAAA